MYKCRCGRHNSSFVSDAPTRTHFDCRNQGPMHQNSITVQMSRPLGELLAGAGWGVKETRNLGRPVTAPDKTGLWIFLCKGNYAMFQYKMQYYVKTFVNPLVTEIVLTML